MRREVWVVCDSCGSSPIDIGCGPVLTIKEAREIAKEQGFVHLELEMIDLCPDCKGKK